MPAYKQTWLAKYTHSEYCYCFLSGKSDSQYINFHWFY